MMNAAFEARGVDAGYSALSIGSDLLAETISSMRSSGVAGANITIPFKSAVMPLIDGSDEVSTRIGAVNSIERSGEGFFGFNTDVIGIAESLVSHGVRRFENALLIGAGGAARAFCEAASTLGCASITVGVRSLERASPFLGDMRSSFPRMSITLVLLADLAHSDADVVFNASPAGTGGSHMDRRMTSVLDRKMVVFDAVYRPVETELLSAASELGCRTIAGHEMLLKQAAASFERWTGQRAPLDVMRDVLFARLGARSR
jgi:shikimate dehydrogenase